MPRQTPVPNLGPQEIAFRLAGGAYDDAANEPTLIAVSSVTAQHPTNPDKVLVYTNARQVNGQGRDVKGADRRLVQIPETVEEFDKNPTDGSTLAQEMRDQAVVHASKFEAAGIAVVTPIAAPPAPAPETPAPAAPVVPIQGTPAP